MENQNLSNLDKHALGLAANAAKHGINILGESGINTNNTNNQGNNQPEYLKLILPLIGLAIYQLFFIGALAIKIVFRSNLGKKDINPVRLILCFICFLSIAIASLYISFTYDHSTDIVSSSDSFFVTAIILIILAFYILIKGIREWKKSKENNILYSDGEDKLLKFLTVKSFLIKKRLNQKDLQSWAEPLITINLGIFYSFYNLLGGSLLVVCGLTFWLALAEEKIFGKKGLQRKAERLNTGLNRDDFNEIN